jgi:flagellar basal body rod protein FlgG
MNDMAQGLRDLFGQATQRMDLIAENLANANTPGYRTGTVLPKNFIGELKTHLSSHQWRVGTDLTPGSIRMTDRPLDFALQGEGFFVVQSPTGPLLTRNGSFEISADGTLLSASGYPVSGDDSRPIALRIHQPIRIPAGTSLEQIQVTDDGELLADGNSLGRLRIERVVNEQGLRRVGTTLFAADPDNRIADSETSVIGRSVETANTTVYQQMADMMVLTRAVEAAQRAQRSETESQKKMMDALA